jgi:transposase
LPPVAQEDLRFKVVEAVQGGIKQVEAARIFKMTRQAIGRWMKAVRLGGVAALKAKPQGRPKTGGKLLPWQAAQIVNTFKKNMFDMPHSVSM